MYLKKSIYQMSVILFLGAFSLRAGNLDPIGIVSITNTLSEISEQPPLETMIIVNLDKILTRGEAYTEKTSNIETEYNLLETLNNLRNQGITIIGLSNRNKDDISKEYIDRLKLNPFTFADKEHPDLYKGAILANNAPNKADILKNFIKSNNIIKKNVYIYDHNPVSVKNIMGSFEVGENVKGYVYSPEKSLSLLELKSPRLNYRLSTDGDKEQILGLNLSVRETFITVAKDDQERINTCKLIEELFALKNPAFQEKYAASVGTKEGLKVKRFDAVRWIVRNDQGEFIGSMSITAVPLEDKLIIPRSYNDGEIEENFDVAIAVDPKFQGQKYGKEMSETLIDAVFKFTNASCLSYEFLENNEASKSLAASLGFSTIFEPIVPSPDVNIYCLTRNEWLEGCSNFNNNYSHAHEEKESEINQNSGWINTIFKKSFSYFGK